MTSREPSLSAGSVSFAVANHEAPAATSARQHAPDPCFTVVFRGDVRAIKDNPFLTDTPFGRPSAVGTGDAFEALAQAEVVTDALLEALHALLDNHVQLVYVQLVSCGDCGNWDVETEEAVIAARAAIAKAEGRS